MKFVEKLYPESSPNIQVSIQQSIPLPLRFASRIKLKDQTIRSWAQAKGFEPATVYHVLNGRLNGSRGATSKKIVAAVADEMRGDRAA